jgi:hypothetical protein
VKRDTRKHHRISSVGADVPILKCSSCDRKRSFAVAIGGKAYVCVDCAMDVGRIGERHKAAEGKR